MSGSGTMNEDTVKQEFADCNNTMKSNADTAGPTDDLKDSNTHDENVMPSPREEEEMIKKKYGGLLPQKLPLISKDHERAFFDSADWALGKQGAQKPKGPLEALRPKLQPTPHQQLRSRRSAYAPADDNEGDGEHNEVPEDKSHKLEDGSGEDIASDERGCRDQLHDAP